MIHLYFTLVYDCTSYSRHNTLQYNHRLTLWSNVIYTIYIFISLLIYIICSLYFNRSIFEINTSQDTGFGSNSKPTLSLLIMNLTLWTILLILYPLELWTILWQELLNYHFSLVIAKQPSQVKVTFIIIMHIPIINNIIVNDSMDLLTF